MRRFTVPGIACALVALATILGCGEEEVSIRKSKKAQTAKVIGPADALVEMNTPDYGTLTGTILFEGEIPKELQEFSGPDKAQCASGSPQEILKQTWLVNPENRGVANAVVFLKPPDGKYFKLKPEDKERKKPVVLRQPHCAFIPHVVAVYPEYYDVASNSMKPTGQKLLIKNDAPFNHNTGVLPNNEAIQSKASFTIASGKNVLYDLKPDPSGPVGFKCDIHPWMAAKGWVFDHPYFAVTDQNGKYEIKNVPVGTAVQLVGWHEGGGYFHGGTTGTTTTLTKDHKFDATLKMR